MKNLFKKVLLLTLIGTTMIACEQGKIENSDAPVNKNKKEINSKSSTQNTAICDYNGQLLLSKTILLDAFNSISNYNAIDVSFSYNQTRDEHSLLFRIDNGSGFAYALIQQGDNYYINELMGTVTHTCSGNPCNSCEMSSTWFKKVKCTCLQDDCSDCKCDHSVSETLGATGASAAPSSGDLIIAIENTI